MDLFEKMENVISAKGREVADKAKGMAEIAGLKAQIATCEEVIKKNYLEIGKLYYNEYRDVPDAPFEKQCRAIANAQEGIRDLQEKIDILKS